MIISFKKDDEIISVVLDNIIADNRFKIFKVRIKEQCYALKLFTTDKKYYFDLESRFDKLSHPNILFPAVSTHAWNATDPEQISNFSIILSEYCTNGSLVDLLMKNKDLIPEKIIRTIFRNIVEGLDFLHSKKIAHLDIKADNIFIDKDFNFRIADFDHSYIEGDKIDFMYVGTGLYSAPEVKIDPDFDPYKADIYSLGILLFTIYFKLFPFDEAQPHTINLFKTFPDRFWKLFQKSIERSVSQDFIELFTGMVSKAKYRYSILDIKLSKWYNCEYYDNHAEFSEVVGKLF